MSGVTYNTYRPLTEWQKAVFAKIIALILAIGDMFSIFASPRREIEDDIF